MFWSTNPMFFTHLSHCFDLRVTNQTFLIKVFYFSIFRRCTLPWTSSQTPIQSTAPSSELIVATSSYSSLTNCWSWREPLFLVSGSFRMIPTLGSSEHLAHSWSKSPIFEPFWRNQAPRSSLMSQMNSCGSRFRVYPITKPWAGLWDQALGQC